MSDGATRREPIAWRQLAARRFALGTCKTRLRRVLSLSATLNQQRMARNVFVYDVNQVLGGKKDHDYVSRSDLKRQDSTQPRCKLKKSENMHCASKEACLLFCCHVLFFFLAHP